MTDQIRQIANTDRFMQLYQSGRTRTEIAQHYGCDVRLINRVVDYLGLVPFNSNDRAPSDEEDEFSRENLMLAPSVYAAAEKFRRRYDERKARETPESTYNKVHRIKWR
jgi:hypothetical protein